MAFVSDATDNILTALPISDEQVQPSGNAKPTIKLRSLPIDPDVIEDSEIINIHDADVEQIEKLLRTMVHKMAPDLFDWIPARPRREKSWMKQQFEKAAPILDKFTNDWQVTDNKIKRAAGDIIELAKMTGEALASRRKPKISIVISDGDHINASIYTEESPVVITVTRGFLKGMKSTDELAAFLGHEIAHKYLRTYNIARGQSSSRGEELASDIQGLEMAARAGYNPRAIIDFWKRCALEDRKFYRPDFLTNLLEEHPDRENRVAVLETRLADHTLFGQKFHINLDHTTPVPDAIVSLNKRKETLHQSHADLFLARDYKDRDTAGKLNALTGWVNTWPSYRTRQREDHLCDFVSDLEFRIDDHAAHHALTQLLDTLQARGQDTMREQNRMLRYTGVAASDDKTQITVTGPLYEVAAAAANFSQSCIAMLVSNDSADVERKAADFLLAYQKQIRFFDYEEGYEHSDGRNLKNAAYMYGILAAPDAATRGVLIGEIALALKDRPEALKALWVSQAHKPEYWKYLSDDVLTTCKTFSGILRSDDLYTRPVNGQVRSATWHAATFVDLRNRNRRLMDIAVRLNPDTDYDAWLAASLPDLRYELSYNFPVDLVGVNVFSRTLSDYFTKKTGYDKTQPLDPRIAKQLSDFFTGVFLPALDKRWQDHENEYTSLNPNNSADSQHALLRYGLSSSQELMLLFADFAPRVLGHDQVLRGLSALKIDGITFKNAQAVLDEHPQSLQDIITAQENPLHAARTAFNYTYAQESFRRYTSTGNIQVLSDDFWVLTAADYNKKNGDDRVFDYHYAHHFESYRNGMDIYEIGRGLFVAPYDDPAVFASALPDAARGRPLKDIRIAYDYLSQYNFFPTPEHRTAMGNILYEKIAADRVSSMWAKNILFNDYLGRNHKSIRDLVLRDRLVNVYVDHFLKEYQSAGFMYREPYLVSEIAKIKRDVNPRDKQIILEKIADALEIQPSQTHLFTNSEKLGTAKLAAGHVGIVTFEEVLDQAASDPAKQWDMIGFISDGNTESRKRLAGWMIEKTRAGKIGLPNVLFDEPQAAVQLEDMRLHYLSLPLEGRAAILGLLLIPGAKRVEQSTYDAEMTKAFDYVLARVVPDNAPEAAQVRSFMKSYLGASENFERVPLLAGLLAAQEESGDGNFSLGKTLARVLPRLGPAYVKLGQSIHSHPQCPPSLRDDLASIKGMAAHEPRWVLLQRLKDTLPRNVFGRIRHFGKVLGSASFNTAMEVRMDGRDRVVLLEHAQARARAAKGFNTMAKTITGWDDPVMNAHKNVALEMTEEARVMSVVETDHAAGDMQYAFAQDAYKNFMIEVRDGARKVKIKLDPVESTASSEGWRVIGKAEGQHFEDMPDDNPDKRLLAKGYLAFELQRIAAGRVFDCDRHGQQLKYVNEGKGAYHFGLYDFGGMAIKPASEKEMRALVRVAINLAQTIQTANGQGDLATMMADGIQNADADARPYLSRVRKSWLALQDFARHLQPQDYLDIADAILSAPMAKTVLSETITTGMRLTGQLPEGQAMTLNAMLALNGSQMLDLVKDAVMGGTKSVVTFKKDGHTVRPGPVQAAVQGRIRREIRTRLAAPPGM